MSPGLPDRQRVAYLLGPERVELRELPVPTPADGELLLRIGAATTCGTDLKVFHRGGHPRMLVAPCPFGHEMAGSVAAVGGGAVDFAVGDRVVVVNSASCGDCDYCVAGRENLCRELAYLNGAFGEYLLVPPRFVARSTYRLPDHLPFELAALTEPFACVLHGLEVAAFPPTSDALVLGCGPIGLMFVAALAARGHRVLAADLLPQRLEVAARLGAADGLALPTSDATQAAIARTPGGDGVPSVVEATGSPKAWETAVGLARPGGTVLLFGGCPPGTTVPLDTHRLHYSEITVKGVYHHRPAMVREALDLLAAGRPDLRHLLSAETSLEGVADALAAMSRGDALKVVIRP